MYFRLRTYDYDHLRLILDIYYIHIMIPSHIFIKLHDITVQWHHMDCSGLVIVLIPVIVILISDVTMISLFQTPIVLGRLCSLFRTILCPSLIVLLYKWRSIVVTSCYCVTPCSSISRACCTPLAPQFYHSTGVLGKSLSSVITSSITQLVC